MRKAVDVRRGVHVHIMNTKKKDNSILDLFGIFSQSLMKWLVS